MNASQQKVVQYLGEAQSSESALVRVLQSQIAMTPRGTYRSGLETHLEETRDHADRVGRRLEALGQGLEPDHGGRRRGRQRRRAGPRAHQDAARPRARLRRRGEGAQERQGRLRLRGHGDRHLHGDRAPREFRRRRRDRQARGVDPRRRGEDVPARPARDPEADRGGRPRRRQGQAVLRRHHDRCRRRPARGRCGDQGCRARDDQAHRAPGPQGPRRRPGRGSGQGRRGLRG